jgi:hypothetical protein
MRHTSSDYKIVYAANLEEIERIRDVWQGMQPHPNSDIDHFLNVLNSRPNVIRPHVVLLANNERPISVVIGRIENIPFELKFGYKTIYSPTVRSLTVNYGGLLGDLSKENCTLLLKDLMRQLDDGQADIVRFNYLDLNSNMYHLATTIPGLLNRDRFLVSSMHWRMSIPDSIEAFYKTRSRKHRYWLRRMEGLLNKDYPNEIKYVIYTSENELSKLFADAEYVAKKTYQRALRVSFSDCEETRKVYTHRAQNGRVRGYILYIKNEPCAFWIGWYYGNTFYPDYTGYDPRFKKYELGTLLFIKMIEDLCSLRNIRYLDFGFADAPYKSRFGNENWQEATVNIFASNLKGIKLNMLNMLGSGSYRFMVALLKRFSLYGKVKRYWRNRAIQKGGEVTIDDGPGDDK